MFGIACFGLLTNLIMIKVLHGGHDYHGHGHSHGHHDHHHNKKIKGDAGSHHHNHEHAHKHERKDNHNIQPQQLADQEKNEIPNLGEDFKISTNDGKKSSSVKNVKTDCGHDDKSDEPKNLSNPASKDNLNVRATIIHILGDIFQSIGVVIASILIWINPDKLKIADPIITFIFGIVILFTTIKIVRDCITVLMEGTPMELKLDEFEGRIKLLEGVNEVHDLHVWSLGVGKPAMTVHIYANSDKNHLLKKVKEVCKIYGIFHSTVQVKAINEQAHENYVDCTNNIH